MMNTLMERCMCEMKDIPTAEPGDLAFPSPNVRNIVERHCSALPPHLAILEAVA